MPAKKSDEVEAFFEALTDDRVEALTALHKYITKTAPSLKPHIVSKMLSYGSFKYTNSKKQEVEWPVIAVASQKQYISLYVCSVVKGKFVAETFKGKLGKVSVGKSCIRFKNFEDLKLDGLTEVIQIAVENPGYGTVQQRKTAAKKKTVGKKNITVRKSS